MSSPFDVLTNTTLLWSYDVINFHLRNLPYLFKCQQLSEARRLLETLFPLLKELDARIKQTEEKWLQSGGKALLLTLDERFVSTKLNTLEAWERAVRWEHEGKQTLLTAAEKWFDG
jgi:hypothetical protein